MFVPILTITCFICIEKWSL